jgi:hypothetical protein
MCFGDWLKLQLLSGHDLSDEQIALMRRAFQHGELNMRTKIWTKVRNMVWNENTGEVESEGARALLYKIKSARLDKG